MTKKSAKEPDHQNKSRKVLRHWTSRYAGPGGGLDLVYVNNEQEWVIERQKGLQRQFLGRVLRSREDARADHLVLTSYPDGEYVAEPHEDCSIWRWAGGE